MTVEISQKLFFWRAKDLASLPPIRVSYIMREHQRNKVYRTGEVLIKVTHLFLSTKVCAWYVSLWLSEQNAHFSKWNFLLYTNFSEFVSILMMSQKRKLQLYSGSRFWHLVAIEYCVILNRENEFLFPLWSY